MSDIDEKIIVEKKEYIGLIQEKGFANGRIAELEKQVKMYQGMVISLLNQFSGNNEESEDEEV